MLRPTDFVRETIDLVKQIETRFLELGARLYKIREERLWEGNYDSFQEFLDSAHISAGMASKLAKIHHVYIVEGKKETQALAGIGYSNLYEAIPFVEEDGVDGAVALAGTLTRSEILDEKREREHGVHTHTIGDARWGICQTCGKFERLYEEETN